MDSIDSRLAPSPEPASHDARSPSHPPAPSRDDLLDFEPVPLRYRTDGLTPRKQREYVEALADTGVGREAAARIGVSEQAISRVRRRSDARDFDRACEAAWLFGARRLRSIAYERAIEGTLKGHYYHGELVSQERVFDNRLLIYLLGKVEALLEPTLAERAVADAWEPCMEALEQGLPSPDLGLPDPEDEESCEPGGDERCYCDEDGTWWTCFPPPDGYDGLEDGELGDPSYRRTLTSEEEAAAVAREAEDDAVEIARWSGMRDRYFGLPPRGAPGFSTPCEAETTETSGDRDEALEDEGTSSPSSRRKPGPMNAEARNSQDPRQSLPDEAPDDPPRHPGESRDLGPESLGGPPPDPRFCRDDEESHIQIPPSRHPWY